MISGGPNQTYVYFLVRNLGEYFITNRQGDSRPVAGCGLDGPRGNRQGEGPDGRQTNILGIRVGGEEVIFTANGTEVTKLPRSKLHTEGMYESGSVTSSMWTWIR